MGTIRTGWEDLYLLRIADSIADPIVAQAWTTGMGIGGTNAMGLLLTDHPNLAAGVSRDINEKTTGLAENKTVEYVDGRQAPAVTLAANVTDASLATFLWLLYQKGSTENSAIAGTAYKTFVPPVKGSTGVDTHCSIARGIGNSMSVHKNQAIHGAICTSLGLSFTAGERVGMTPEMMGTLFATDENISAASSFTAGDTAADLLMYDYSFRILNNTGNLWIDCSNYTESLELTLASNAATKYYGSQTPANFLPQRYTATGTLKIAMSATTAGDNTQIDAYVAGESTLLQVSKGFTSLETAEVNTNHATDVVTDGYTRLHACMMYTGAEVDPAEELMLNLPFDCVTDSTVGASGYGSFEAIVHDGIVRWS